jgi:hypothetical protein
MGCDAHFYIQYKKKTDDDRWWWDFGGRINPGRNYAMFGILAGVRDHNTPHSFDPKGILPYEKQSYSVRDDLYLTITEDGNGDNETTLEQALKWSREDKIIKDADGNPYKVLHPDWHSHSWMTIDELKQACKWYKKYAKESGYDNDVPLEYKVILKTMKALEDKGKNDVIAVFWFDN